MLEKLSDMLKEPDIADPPAPVVYEPDYEEVDMGTDMENLQDDYEFVRQKMRDGLEEFAGLLPTIANTSKFSESPQFYDSVSKAYAAFGKLANDLIDMNIKVKTAKQKAAPPATQINNSGTVNNIAITNAPKEEPMVDVAEFLANEHQRRKLEAVEVTPKV